MDKNQNKKVVIKPKNFIDLQQSINHKDFIDHVQNTVGTLDTDGEFQFIVTELDKEDQVWLEQYVTLDGVYRVWSGINTTIVKLDSIKCLVSFFDTDEMDFLEPDKYIKFTNVDLNETFF